MSHTTTVRTPKLKLRYHGYYSNDFHCCLFLRLCCRLLWIALIFFMVILYIIFIHYVIEVYLSHTKKRKNLCVQFIYSKTHDAHLKKVPTLNE